MSSLIRLCICTAATCATAVAVAVDAVALVLLPCLTSGANGLSPAAAAAAADCTVQDFQRWLLQASTAAAPERRQLLSQWSKAPGGRQAHPREEHLLPLMVVAGAAHSDAAAAAAGAAGAAGTCSSSDADKDSRGHVLWDGVCMGAAVAGLGFGGFAA